MNELDTLVDVEGYRNAPVTTFLTEASSVQPRVFDTYVLPPFLIAYAFLSKRPMRRMARRILFTAGMYMMYRNISTYRNLIKEVNNGVGKTV